MIRDRRKGSSYKGGVRKQLRAAVRVSLEHKQLNESQQRILEVNPNHPIIIQLKNKLDGGTSASDLEDYTEVLYGQAIIQEGESLPDPANFTKKLNKILAAKIA